MGLGVSLSNELAQSSDFIDLLISMGYTASTSGRKDLIFNPFPLEFKNESQVKDFNKLKLCLDLIPSVDEMLKNNADEMTLKSFLKSKSVPELDVFRLVRFFVTTNRAHFIKIPKEKQVKDLNTEHQYLMLSAAPEKKLKFDAEKKKSKDHFSLFMDQVLKIGMQF